MTSHALQMARPGFDDGLARIRAVFVWLIFAVSFIVIFEPAPTDIFAIASLTFLFFPGVSVLPALLPLLMFYSFLMLGYFTSFYANIPDINGIFFMFSTGYILLASFFVACFLAQDTDKRFSLIKSGYYFAGAIATIIALAAYLDPQGFGMQLVKFGASGLIVNGRATGAFKDPNVFSTYMVFPIVMLFQRVLLGESKRPLIDYFWLGAMFLALFLAFSRGAWINLAMALTLVIALTFITTKSTAMRGRITFYSLVSLFIFAAILMALLSIPEIQKIFADRFALTKSYDSGETGRFGNQINAIPMLLNRPFGFGPYHFERYFTQAPHNAFLNPFSSGGWLGGITYFAMVGCNIYIGIKSVFTRSPFQGYAILIFSCLVAVTFQGIQIDEEHWRHYYWMIGMMWGVFAAIVHSTRRTRKLGLSA
jgi:O-Antigen ligase